MKIKDKRNQSKELTEYHVGDVIVNNCNSFFMVVSSPGQEVGMVNLVTGRYDTFYSMEDMFNILHDPSDRLVNAHVVIES